MSFGIPVRNGLAIGLLSSTTLSSNGGLFPAMALNFLIPSLDSRVTFTRGSNATLVDSTGKITYAPANLFTYSEQFDDVIWAKGASGVASVPVVTANAGVAPDGANTADRVQMTLNGGTAVGDIVNLNQTTPFTPGNHIFSIWLRSNTGLDQTLLLVLANGQGSAITVTPTWQRFFLQNNVSATSSGSGIRLRGSFTGNTADILVWGAQLEPVTYQTTPSTYVATTTAAYYGPRFDYDPVTLAPRGLLIEEQRVNLLLYSAQFDNAAWNKSSVTVTANTVSAPDGTATADTLTSSGSSGTIFQTTPSTSASFTYSVYVRPDTVTTVELQIAQSGNGFKVAFNLTNGTAGAAAIVGTGGTVSAMTGAIVSAGGGWYRCSVSYTSGGIGNAFLNVPAAGVVYAWGAQLEAGSFATSYIPTVASQVTRSADIASMTGTNFSSWYNASEGTFVADADTAKPPSVAAANFVFIASDGTQNERVQNVFDTSNITAGVIDGNVTQANFTNAYALNQIIKSAIAYKVNDFAASFNGTAATTDTSGTIPTVNRLNLGSSWDGSNFFLNGHIRSIAYFNTRLTNVQLQQLTAPPLVTTLSLDFINGVYNA